MLWIGLPLLVASLVSLPWLDALRFERAAIAGGEPWRLWSGMFVHLGFSHATLNIVLVTAALIVFPGGIGQRVVWVVLCVSLLLTGPLIWWVAPMTVWYAGLSGPLHGVFFGCALIGTVEDAPGCSWVLLAVTTKLALEWAAGPLPGAVALTGGPVASDTHLVGALAGLIAVALWLGVRVSGRRV